MGFKNILFEVKGNGGIITINIPGRLNPINIDVKKKDRILQKATLSANNEVRVVGWFGLTLGFTLRFASEHAKMGLPEINVGCIPGNGGIQRLSRLIGKGRAMWYLLTGEFMSAQEAY